MSWGRWGQPPADTDEVPVRARPDGPVLTAGRYCPRCDRHTGWNNSSTGWTLTLACEGCGLTTAGALTEAEHDRLLAYDARPVIPRRRPWVHT